MKTGMIFFLLLPLAGLVYALWHVWAVLPWQTPWRVVAVAVGVLAFMTVFINFSGGLDRLPLWMASALYETGTTAIMVLLYLVIIFLLLDIGRMVHLVPRAWVVANGVTACAVTGLMVTLFVCGNIHYNNKVRVPLTLSTTKSVGDGKPVHMLMASDLHLGYHNRRAELARWVDMINGEKPDVVLIAGDIIDISVHPLMVQDMAAELRRIEAPVYASLGNHEYYSDTARAAQFFCDAHIHLLRDTSAQVAPGVVVIGRDDRSNMRRKSVAQLCQEADTAGCYTILLDHQPYHLEQTEQARIDFQLSGHTHRGQVWPISWITDAIYEKSWGSHQRGATKYYVSSGLGIWGGKYRIGTQSEYVVATLRGE